MRKLLDALLADANFDEIAMLALANLPVHATVKESDVFGAGNAILVLFGDKDCVTSVVPAAKANAAAARLSGICHEVAAGLRYRRLNA